MFSHFNQIIFLQILRLMDSAATGPGNSAATAGRTTGDATLPSREAGAPAGQVKGCHGKRWWKNLWKHLGMKIGDVRGY